MNHKILFNAHLNEKVILWSSASRLFRQKILNEI